MKKKYIIELEDNQMAYATTIIDGMPYIKLLQTLPYTAPDLEQVQKEAYDKGYMAAYVKSHMETKGSYQQGLNDAWEAARTIVKMDWEEKNKIFGKLILLSNIFSDNTASEAIEKLKQYEHEQKEIKIGDEVTDDKGDTGVCTEISYSANSMHIMYADGTATDISLTGITKTGKHYPEMAAILEKMREGQEQ